MVSLSYAFRIGQSTVSGIIQETCLAIWDSLHNKYLCSPTKENFMNIANDFENMWNMPHCTGALDGKHIVVQVLTS